jgi:hypothetical protein
MRDLEIVLDRVPDEYRTRLRDVFLSWRSGGVRRLGWVRRRGRLDVNLISMLPPRVSLRQFIVKGQSPREFGAPARGQWPPWAERLVNDCGIHPETSGIGQRTLEARLDRPGLITWNRCAWFQSNDLVKLNSIGRRAAALNVQIIRPGAPIPGLHLRQDADTCPYSLALRSSELRMAVQLCASLFLQSTM